MKNTISIVGGGLVGSLLSIYLGRRGYKVRVFEARPDMRHQDIPAGRSINMACSTRGWRALDEVGVGELVRKSAIPMYGRMMHSLEGDLTYQPYSDDRQAIYSISRAGLNKILMDFAEDKFDVEFIFNRKCVEMSEDKSITTFLNVKTGEHENYETPVLFGADGIYSKVREQLFHEEKLEYKQTNIGHSYKELHIPVNKYNEFALESNALHIWPRGEFMLIALPNPDKSFTCTLFLPSKGDYSFAELHDEASVARFFNSFFPDVKGIMPGLQRDFHKNTTSGLGIIRSYPWSSEGKVCLLGDAAHAIVPFYGQGMIAGFEDCYTLNGLMDKHGDNWEQIFKAFEEDRKPNADAIADLAMRNFVEMRDLVGDPRFIVRKLLEQKIERLHPDVFQSLYSMVSFSNIPYKEALDKGVKQDSLLDELMEKENIEDNWDSPETEQLIEELLHRTYAE